MGFPNDVRQGITLHRDIDAFTDAHPATREGREIFRPAYRLYSGAILDVIYDHYLANDPSVFPGNSLEGFVQDVYSTLEEHAAILPQHFLQALFYMRTENWLLNYRHLQGIGKSLRGMVRRTTYLTESDTAMELLSTRYKDLEQIYAAFFPDVKQYANQRLAELL